MTPGVGTRGGESAPGATGAADAFAAFKAAQRETWAGFAANEGLTTLVAGELVAFARVAPGDAVLDVGCGTGVVAIAAALASARATGIDLTPVLLERARTNAATARVDVPFTEGDAEALPYGDASFDVVLSQFGHMFAPRPEVALAEMLRVLRPGGRIAFATWPPEHAMGRIFAAIAHASQPLAGEPQPPPVTRWGDPGVVRERLGARVDRLRFGRSAMRVPALSPAHVLASFETGFGPLTRLLARLDAERPALAAEVRADMLRIVEDHVEGTAFLQHYLLTQAIKAT